MKKLILALLSLLCISHLQAQNVEGQIIAAQYGEYKVPGQSTGGFTFPSDTCQVTGGGKNFSAFATGVAVKIVDANPALTEIATPSSVFITQCTINMATTYNHVPPYYLTSGTGGLQEAITANQQGIAGPNSIILNAEWYNLIKPRSAATVIASAQGNTNMPLVDITTTPYTWYQWSGSAYVAVPIGSGGGGIPCNGVANWSSITPYFTTQFTCFNGVLYTATADSTNQQPSSVSAFWDTTFFAGGALGGGVILGGQFFSGGSLSAEGAPVPAFVSDSGNSMDYEQQQGTDIFQWGAQNDGTTQNYWSVFLNNTAASTTHPHNFTINWASGGFGHDEWHGAVDNFICWATADSSTACKVGLSLDADGATVDVGIAQGDHSKNIHVNNMTVDGTCVGCGSGGSPQKFLSVSTYGAVCNWNGTTGTDDSTAFQSAITAANAIYAASGNQVTVTIPYGCTLGTGSGQTTINLLPGVRLEGPGSIYVPAQSANPLFLAQSASDVTVDNLIITMVTNLSACGPTQNNATCSAIRWDGASGGTGTAYKRVSVTNNTIINSDWGITLIAQAGLDTLSDVHVDGNTVMESQVPTTSYQYADGIHVGGAVTAVTINHNIVVGRGDAGIAVTTEATSRLCSNVAITGNTLSEDRIGIDDSGCSSLTVSGNQVHADIVTSSSNPAFRSIYYNGLPTNVNVMGNNFENYQGSGTDVSAKYDCEGGCGNGSGTVFPFNSKFTGNKVFSMYVRGSGIDFSGNTFEPNGTFDLDWDTANGNGSANDTIGQNSWQGSGTFSNDSRSDIYFHDYIAPQVAGPGAITFTHPGEIAAIAATYSNIIDTALTAGTSPVCPNGTGGALTTSGCTSAAGGVTSVNSGTGAVTIAGTGGTTVSTSGSTVTVSSSSSGGTSNANFMFVGDSITCGLYSSSSCANLGPGAGAPVVTNSTGYSAQTTGTASSGSTTMTVASATGIINGEVVVGVGIPIGTFETISGTTVTLSQPTTAPLSTTAVSFGLMDYPAQAMRLGALTGNSNTGINAGVSGWRSDQIISAYTTIVHPYSPAVTGKSGYLFVMIGTNDLLQGVPGATTEANLTAYWQMAHNDGWKVIALTIPNGPWGANSWQQWINLNQYIRQSATQWDRLIDEATVLSNNYDNTLWNTDHIHPINGGYSILAALANQSIATSGSVLPTEQILPWSSGYGDIFYPVITGGLVTTGFYDAAFGILAFQQATNDYQDAAFGASALALANGSHDDSAFGHYTQGNVSTGYQNSSVGSFACNGITTGHDNACLGYNADVSAGGSVGRVQLGPGTNGTDNTLQFDGINFLTNAGGATFASVTSVLGSEESVASSTTPTFSINFRESTTIVTANITTFTLASGIAGQEKTLTFCQNATGGFTVSAPSNVRGFMTVGATATKCNSQHFTYNSIQTAWLADSPGVVNQ